MFTSRASAMIRIIFPLLLGIATLLPLGAVAAPVTLADNAPDSYVVKRGDTLWHISGRFLKQPWRWPEVWRMNRDQIRNPHLIYPGQIVYLDRSGPYLRLGKPVGSLYEKRFPQAYSEQLGTPVPSISLAAIKPFLTRPLVVDDGVLAQSATIIAVDEKSVYAGPGDTVFAKNVKPGIGSWQVYRPAKALKDPLTGEILAYEAFHLGAAQVIADGSPATLRLSEAYQEVGRDDLLAPAVASEFFSYVPHAPESKVEARVVSIYDGVDEAGRNNVISLSFGQRDGAEVGHVLALYRERGSVDYRDAEGKQTYKLPEKRSGLVFVFRTFDRVSYGLILESDGPVTVGDSVRQP